MTSAIDPAFLKASLCALTEVESTNQGIEVTLPQAYHTGEAVVVVVSSEREGYVVHDNSYAALVLSNAGISPGRRLAEALRPQILEYGCELDGLRVVRRCTSQSELAYCMVLVGSASRLIADQALKADKPPLYDFKSSLLSQIIELVGSKRLRTNEEVSGHLGSRYRVSAVVLDTLESQPVAFVEPIADREAIARRFKQFYDLRVTPAYRGIDLIAVYDEANPIPPGDALLMQEVGNLVRFADVPARMRQWLTVQ